MKHIKMYNETRGLVNNELLCVKRKTSMEDDIETLNALLMEASTKLDASASLIRDLELNKDRNIYKIGEALANVFEIQHEIYERRPDLKPRYLEE